MASLLLLLPHSAAGQRVEEVWDTLAMRGTRSNNLILEDCFVPEEHLCVRTDNLSTLLDAAPTWGRRG